MATPRFPPEKLSKYPHMFPEDIEIWERFLTDYGSLYRGFDYDIKVGEGRAVELYWEPKIKRMVEVLTKKRIDAVGYMRERIDIIEVKPRASTTAIGQVLTYARLYEEEFGPDLPVQPVIVTDELLPDTEHVAGSFDIELVVV